MSIRQLTFDNFVVGDSNKFAYHAALMVLESPGEKYNPLFIYGGTGLGKTHLLCAMKDRAEKSNPAIKARYVKTSTFIDEFVATITLKEDGATFYQKYLDSNIVLFDDIQALSGTCATQGKLLALIDSLFNAGAHIVFSSDRPPRAIPLAKGILSRLEGGLTIDITPPDLATRVAILEQNARAENLDIPCDTLVYIASHDSGDIRSLEGMLKRVIASSRLYGTCIDIDMVKDILEGQNTALPETSVPSIGLIQSLVAAYCQVDIGALMGMSRSHALVHARQMAAFLCKEMTGATQVDICEQFGNRGHFWVIYHWRKIKYLLGSDERIRREVRELTDLINWAIGPAGA